MKFHWSKSKAQEKKWISLPALVQWDAEDLNTWKMFLKTPTGSKLVEVCRAKVITDSVSACYATDAEAKLAAGQDTMLRWMFNLASEDTLKRISDSVADSTVKPNTHDEELTTLASSERRCGQ